VLVGVVPAQYQFERRSRPEHFGETALASCRARVGREPKERDSLGECTFKVLVSLPVAPGINWDETAVERLVNGECPKGIKF
jgi:hypothetical protein